MFVWTLNMSATTVSYSGNSAYGISSKVVLVLGRNNEGAFLIQLQNKFNVQKLSNTTNERTESRFDDGTSRVKGFHHLKSLLSDPLIKLSFPRCPFSKKSISHGKASARPTRMRKSVSSPCV